MHGFADIDLEAAFAGNGKAVASLVGLGGGFALLGYLADASHDFHDFGCAGAK